MNATDAPTGPIELTYARESRFWRTAAECLIVVTVGLLIVAVTL